MGSLKVFDKDMEKRRRNFNIKFNPRNGKEDEYFAITEPLFQLTVILLNKPSEYKNTFVFENFQDLLFDCGKKRL